LGIKIYFFKKRGKNYMRFAYYKKFKIIFHFFFGPSLKNNNNFYKFLNLCYFIWKDKARLKQTDCTYFSSLGILELSNLNEASLNCDCYNDLSD